MDISRVPEIYCISSVFASISRLHGKLKALKHRQRCLVKHETEPKKIRNEQQVETRQWAEFGTGGGHNFF